jgi:hypothetical protein
MNFRRGLFRLWLVLSLAWTGFILYMGQGAFCATYKPLTAEETKKYELTPKEREDCRVRGETQCLPSFIPIPDSRQDCSLSPSDGYVRNWYIVSPVIEQALWPPGVSLMLGLVLLWVIGGFRRQPNRV